MLLDCREGGGGGGGGLLPYHGFILNKVLGGQRETPILQFRSVVFQLEEVPMLLSTPAVVQPEIYLAV